MREIKFRVWMGDPNDYRQGEIMSADVAFNENYIEFGEYGELKPTDECSFIMQFTGLKDKNGKEIYEGDLLTHKFYKKPVAVEWDNCLAMFTSGDISLTGTTSLEVIGNIYENPELIA